MKCKRHHFVPQHYLRQFRTEGTKQVATALVAPYRFVGRTAINRQCQEDYFYGADNRVDELLQHTETDIAPVLVRVADRRSFDDKELVALRLLGVVLNARTRKAAEAAKVFPKHMADEVIKCAIARGDLPAPEGGYEDGTMDFKGVPGFMIGASVIPCWLEAQTLAGKLLEAPPTTQFITSDHPVALLNEFFADAEPARSFVGFSRSGFQLVLPISPRLVLFLYDPNVYKVGARRTHLVSISSSDAEIINSLQVQSADRCIYFQDSSFGPEVRRIIARHAVLRRPIASLLTERPGRNEKETFLHIKRPSVRLPRQWTFCRRLRRVRIGHDSRRSPAWSTLIREVERDMQENPQGGDLFERMEKILGCSLRDPAPTGSSINV
jgi:hypothetical protein